LNKKMEKKKVLVIGASGDIGFESAIKLHKEGFYPILTYNERKDKLLKKIDDSKIRDYEVIKFNSKDEKNVLKCMSKIIADHDHIDCVVLSVSAPLINKSVFDVEWENFQNNFEVQLKGLLYLVKAMKPMFLNKKRVKFIIILTEACFGKPPTGLSPYVVSKYALMGLSKCFGAELSRYNCTFNTVSPGLVDTDLISGFPSKLVEIAAENNPLKRIANTNDVANVIVFLASDKSNYVNGANILVNGGSLVN